mgnify:CR=1 FL=1
MRSLRTLTVAALAATALLARPVHAQVSLGLGGGYTSPSGDLADFQKQGWNLLGSLQVGVPIVPLQFRGDLQYNSLSGNDFDVSNSIRATGEARIISATANAVWNIVPLGPVKPYLIGGAGYYTSNFSLENVGGTFDRDTRKFGYNYGVGVKVGLIGLAGFIEARMHTIPDGLDTGGGAVRTSRYIPITVGIFF